jgi:predicted metal-dependent phosphoesterase TrpH
MKQSKTLIHIHTDYSYDSDITPRRLVHFAEENGFGCLAVTDHDTIDGAVRMRSMTDLRVIVGEEISTADGHMIGLFLRARIEPGMSARETALAIKEQNGLVLTPHPFNKLFGSGIGKVAWDMLDLIDAVEINNAQNAQPAPDWAAARFARRAGLTAYVGADSHRETSIAPCYQVMRPFDGPADFLSALQEATLVPGRHPFRYFVEMGYQIVRHVARAGLPTGVGRNAQPAPARVPSM